MPRSKKIEIGLILLLALLLGCTSALAQQVTAAITGTVVDPAGAAVTGATVTAKDVERGTTTAIQTNDSGTFNFPRLSIGNYQVRVEAPGFESQVQPPIELTMNQTARISFQMKLGKTTETVEVTSSAPELQTDTTQVSTLIDAKNNDALPLATRNFIQLTLLAPGSLSVDPQSMNTGSNVAEEGGRPYINGNREQANNFMLDGIDNNQSSENLAGFTPSPDAIAEFNVITQNAPAEFGNFNGGIVSASIKSGTNGFHGNAFEFFRNDIFNANKWENGLNKGNPDIGVGGVIPTPALRWNMFGATFGGPIIKNKLFFFVDYQGGRLDHPPSPGTISVLTDAEKHGDFSALLSQTDVNGNPLRIYNPCAAGTGINGGTPCQLVPLGSRQAFPGNIIPTNMLDPTFTALVTNSLYPQSQTSQSGFGLAENSLGQQYNTDQGDLRIDYNAGQNDHMFGRMSKGYQTDPTTNSQPLLGNSLNNAFLDNFAYNWDHNFSSNLLNELRLGLNYVKFSTGLSTFDASVGALGNTIGIQNGNPAGIDGLPLIGVGGGGVTDAGVGSLAFLGSAGVVQNFSSTVLQIDDVVEYTHGKHNFKAGFQGNEYRLNVFYSGNGGELGQLLYGTNYSSGLGVVNGQPAPVGGNGAIDWALGLPEDVGRGTSTGGWHQRDYLFAGFIQDDWRITPELTLNLGLRYEARTPWREINNRQVNVNIANGLLEYAGGTPVQGVGATGGSEGLYNTTYGLPDWQPRFGFAWQPAMLGGKTVIRGAFTISSYLEGTGTNLRLTQNPPFTPAQVEASNVSTGTPYNTGNAFVHAAPPGGDPFQNATMLAWDTTVQPAVAKQWNLTIQQELQKNLTFQIGYVGQATQHLMVPEWLSQGFLNPNGTVTPSQFAGGTNANGTLGPNQFGNVKDTASNGSMNYNALQAVLQQRSSHGLDAQVSYTYSKCMTNNDGYYGTWGANTETTPAANYWQNLYNPQADYAQCYWDAKHVISAYATYELPVGKGKQWGSGMNPVVNAVIGNWTIAPIVSWHTGFPIALYGPDDSGTGSPAPRPNCNGPVQYLNTTSTAGRAWFSQSTFSAPPDGTFGNCPAQGPVIGPKYTDADISLQKNFPVSEHMRFQFRADFLNAFNHPNFAHPDQTYGDTNFGVIGGTQDARQIQFALKFYF